MILPTRRWYAGAIGLGLLAPITLRQPQMSGLLLVADFVWVMAWLVDAWWVSAVDLAAFPVVREAPPAFSVGRPLPVTYRWRNPARRALHLLVRESIPPLIESTAAPERSLSLPVGKETIEQIEFIPRQRGKVLAGTMHLRLAGPLGLVWRQARRDIPWPLVVYPPLQQIARNALPTPAQQRREAGFRNLRRVGAGRVFESLKEWVPGDETRSIDWKATARRGKLMSRQYEDERRQQVMIVIDAGRLLTAEIAGHARLESAINAALELAYSAADRDDDVGCMVFADEVLHYSAPARGRRAVRGILDALAGLQGRLVEPNYPAAFAYLAARSRKRAFTVFFTDVIDRTASEAFVAHAGTLRPRHLPLAVTLRDPALERLVIGRPATVEAAYERAAAEELLDARAGALTELRSRGVLVLDVHPDNAARAVVEQYQRLKRKAAI